PHARRPESDVHEAGARVGAKTLEADRAGRLLEGDRVVVSHGHVEGGAIEVLRARRATDGTVVGLAAVGRADDQRLAQPVAKGLQLVERLLVDAQATAAAAGDLGGREVLPAPAGWMSAWASAESGSWGLPLTFFWP